ncbi:MAG: hypothetical protein FWD31_04220 [Planctomycetaceae bacterium]|nr:hypothetical protein [Planctomycetaceae bacterium]
MNFVVGQSNDFQRMEATPRRLRGTLPPVTHPTSVNQSPAILPTYHPQDNTQSTSLMSPAQVANAFGVGPAVAQQGQQLRQVSHSSDEDAETKSRPMLAAQGQSHGVATVTPPSRELSGGQNSNVPASATIRRFVDDTETPTHPASDHSFMATMSVNANGNWGKSDDVPEHVYQGISQIQEQPQLAMMPPLGQGVVPEITGVPQLFDTMQGDLGDSLALRLDGNDLVPGSAPNLSFGGPADGLIPFQPLLPDPPPHDIMSQLSSQFADEPKDNVRMSFGNLPPISEPGIAPQNAVPEPRISRNSSEPLEVRNDGALLQLDIPLNGNKSSHDHQEGTGVPGSGELAGAQIPQLVIEKIMPRETLINDPVTIRFNIRNTGSSKAKNVVLTDRLPKGARFVEAGVSASRTTNGDISWQLGDIGVNEERNVEMTLIPTAEGEIGSVATATFSVEASASTRVTKPALLLEVATVGDEHLVGGDLVLDILISNPGTGVARNITLEEFVPDGLSHPKGKKLSSDFGHLNPNESKQLRLTLKCERAGEMTNYLIAKGDNDLIAESKLPIVVLAPALTLAIDGPKNRYLERRATYELQVGNPGSATTREIILIAKLPKGIDFVNTDSMGAYDPETHTVHWMLDTLPSRQSGKIELVTLPRAIGEYKIEFIGRALGDLQAGASLDVSVDGIASLGFEILNKVDPVELGREAVYEIRIFNRGTKPSSNISLRLQLPDDMRFVAAEGPTQHRITGSAIDFGNLFQLAPREEKTYLVRAQCLAVGDQRVIVQVQSDEMERPVTKEENTNVYGDE